MDDLILQELRATNDLTKKAAIVAESVFNELPTERALVARRCIILHWFDQPVVEALLQDTSLRKNESQAIYEQLASLPFIEALSSGLTFQGLTREGLLKHYTITHPEPELLRRAASLAAPAYEAREEDEKIAAEALFCYIVAGNQRSGMRLLDNLLEQASSRGDFQRLGFLLQLQDEAERLPFVDPLFLTERQWILRALVHRIQGKQSAAIFAYNKAIAINPRNPRTYFSRGTTYAEQAYYSARSTQEGSLPYTGIMHDTLWRNDQVTVVFRSDIPLFSEGNHNTELLLRNLNLPLQLQRLNQFLQENHVPATLTFFDDNEKPIPPGQPVISDASNADSSKLPSGVHHFGLTAPIQTDFGEMISSVISFLNIQKEPARSASDTTSERALPGNGHDSKNDEALIRTIVTTLNDGLGHLNMKSMVPIAFSAPTWLCGGANVSQGCPLTPPMPVVDACSYWHITLPDLNPQLQSMTGDGVTVFILDAFPEREVISRAARYAGDHNLLLSNVNETVSFDYSLMSGVQEILDMASTGNTAVGKDVYGEHYPFRMADHGLFIAGIVRDVAPQSKIECIRVLNDLGVGDLNKAVGALWRIYNRMSLVNPETGQGGDLYQKPVVINLSLCIPTDQEAQQKHINSVVPGFNIIQGDLLLAITSLTQIGAIVVAPAGNEGDLREMGLERKRPMALYPAAFGNSIHNVIAVGAVTSNDTAASYSCYPGSRGIATYGGEVPEVQPLDPPSINPVVTIKDALRGIYSSVVYPPVSAVPADPPAQYYAAPNDYAWAYWMGTSFATPIVSGVAARILELKATGILTDSVHDAILKTASGVVTWDNLDPSTGDPVGTTTGPMLKAMQICIAEDTDGDDDDTEIVVSIS
jgi:subtilisin family serine protease/tetratricopeptide (TPR) repeat protein